MGSIKLRSSQTGKKIVSQALRQTVEKMRLDVQRVLDAGKRIDPYSLGFTNAMIFCEHQVNGGRGKPQLYKDDLTITGGIPKPRPLLTDEEEQQKEKLDFLLDDLVVAARDWLGEAKPDRLQGVERRLAEALLAITQFENTLGIGPESAANDSTPMTPGFPLADSDTTKGRGL